MILQQLIWALQALASDHKVQKLLYPDWADVADELVLDHDAAQRAFLSSALAKSLTKDQAENLLELDNYIVELSDRDDLSLWTAEALESRDEWNTIRRHSIKALRSLGYSLQKPPSSCERGVIYFKRGE